MRNISGMAGRRIGRVSLGVGLSRRWGVGEMSSCCVKIKYGSIGVLIEGWTALGRTLHLDVDIVVEGTCLAADRARL